AERVARQPDPQQLLRHVRGDQPGRGDAVDVDPAGGDDGGDDLVELVGVELGGGVGEGFGFGAGDFGDDVGERVVGCQVAGDEAFGFFGDGGGEGEAQLGVTGEAERSGGADDRRLAGAGHGAEFGDGAAHDEAGVVEDDAGDGLGGGGERRQDGADRGDGVGVRHDVSHSAAAWADTREMPWVATWVAPVGSAGMPVSMTITSGRSRTAWSMRSRTQEWRAASCTTRTAGPVPSGGSAAPGSSWTRRVPGRTAARAAVTPVGVAGSTAWLWRVLTSTTSGGPVSLAVPVTVRAARAASRPAGSSGSARALSRSGAWAACQAERARTRAAASARRSSGSVPSRTAPMMASRIA